MSLRGGLVTTIRMASVVMTIAVGCAPSAAPMAPATSVMPAATSRDDSDAFDGFVTRRGDQLFAGTHPFRFVSFNVPNLHYVEDHLPFEGTNPWRFPNTFEIEDAVATVAQLGGRVVRTYTLSVRGHSDPPDVPRHVLGPGRFDDEAFRTLDEVLAIANRHRVRVIVPLVDNWRWWGGIAEYAAFRGKQRAPTTSEDDSAFWTDRQLIDDFKATLRHVLHRTNTITGVRYADDPTILAWEPANEPRDPYAWTREIAAYIKELDPNHLVLDGYHSRGDGPALRESLDDPNVDIVSTHHYGSPFRRLARGLGETAAMARGKKPYVIGEFGLAGLQEIEEVLQSVVAEGLTGALGWSLRPHHRDGGFYWHSEGSGAGTKAYHWPGFASGDAYEERSVLRLMRAKAYEIRGRAVPPLPVPAPPELLPIADVGAISWRGSVGAASYRVERAGSLDGPWVVVAGDVSDAATQYRPLLSDETAPLGAELYYRARASNEAGISAPSNVVGPVSASWLTLVDELAEPARYVATSGPTRLDTEDARRMREDAHRLAMNAGSSVTYRVPGVLTAVRCDFFFEDGEGSAKLEVSVNGRDHRPLTSRVTRTPTAPSSYGFWVPTRVEGDGENLAATHVRVTAETAGQLGRIELRYVPTTPASGE